ncbi:rna binding protein [Moniliophthora roreri]|uniref:RRM domain-containing protein n=1 Tax=Moniliophthora roreri TaxID=221103 RepID=A0A0W0FGE7_MONRR|nr:rna binding protein [Moniliophthora roreri]
MSSTRKLTKKQKKAFAFRERKTGKSAKNVSNDMEGNEVPTMENQDMLDLQGDKVEDQAMGGVQEGPKETKKSNVISGSGEGRAKEKVDIDERITASSRPKKRKRENEKESGEETVESLDQQKSKRRKMDEDKPRYILFLGNLKYTTSVESITAHFSTCDPPPSVRLLTLKTASSSKLTAKSKGCAFLEFANRTALQQALKMHHSKLDGRTINVELTVGGGGNSEARISKLRERNKKLHDQKKGTKSAKTREGESEAPRSQRYSSTSGVGDAPKTKRTWTVGDSSENGAVHRGGKRRKTRKPAAKDWGTGVNAIPVG